MDSLAPQEISNLLILWKKGDFAAQEKLFQTAYPVLRKIADRQLTMRGGIATLSARDVVHESFLKLAAREHEDFADSNHFYALLAKVMRGYVLDYHRARYTAKRGGNLPLIFSDDLEDPAGNIEDWLSLESALSALEATDAQCAQLVELKFYAGMTTAEIALATEQSTATVVRKWRFARAWLSDYLEDPTLEST